MAAAERLFGLHQSAKPSAVISRFGDPARTACRRRPHHRDVEGPAHAIDHTSKPSGCVRTGSGLVLVSLTVYANSRTIDSRVRRRIDDRPRTSWRAEARRIRSGRSSFSAGGGFFFSRTAPTSSAICDLNAVPIFVKPTPACKIGRSRRNIGGGSALSTSRDFFLRRGSVNG
jgi:hypothetical protein